MILIDGQKLMPRKFFKKYLPSPAEMRKKKALNFLGEKLYAQNLWHLNRRSVSKAFLFGIFASFLPIPFQMVVAAVLAIIYEANIPLSVALVWISNPLTWVPIFYSTYKLGAWILGIVPSEKFSIDLSVDWVLTQLVNIWKPLLLGSLIAGIVCSIASYFIIHQLWRFYIIHSWNKRKKNRAKAQEN